MSPPLPPIKMASDGSGAAPPEIDLKAQMEKEKNDPSMVAYLKSLGIDPDYQAPEVTSTDVEKIVLSC